MKKVIMKALKLRHFISSMIYIKISKYTAIGHVFYLVLYLIYFFL